MTNPEYITVVAAVIEKDGKILLARRKTSFRGNYWEFPGGKLEINETLDECLKREISEELAIEIEVGPFISLNKHVLNCQSAIELYAYKAVYVSGEIKLKDHDEIRWVLPEDLLTYDYPDPDRLIALEVISQYNKDKNS